MHNKEPGVFLILSSLAMAIGGICFGLYPVTQSVVIRQFGLLFVGAAVFVQILHSVIGNAPQKSNVFLSLLGRGMVSKLVYFALGLSAVGSIIGIVLQSTALAVFAQSCFWVVLGLVGLVASIVWHANNSSLERKRAVAARALMCVCVGALTVSILEPVVRSDVFDSPVWFQYSELPRPGIDAILGGDEVFLSNAAIGLGCGGTISFYTGDGVAVAMAHYAKRAEHANTIRIGNEVIPHVAVIANTKAGVVLNGVPVPGDRRLLPIGGTADIALGAKAIVYPPGKSPYEVTVKKIGQREGLLHISLHPDNGFERSKAGWSGSPIVQNGAIIAFISSSHSSGEFYAIVAAELYEELRPYLTPDH